MKEADCNACNRKKSIGTFSIVATPKIMWNEEMINLECTDAAHLVIPALIAAESESR